MIIYVLQTESNYDFLYIYDGSSDQSPLIDNLNGNLGSFSLSSPGNSLLAVFDSDGSVTRSGFLATLHYSNSTSKTQDTIHWM